jgi:ABC-type phosphate/phosphonate transport system substrate-binding protein
LEHCSFFIVNAKTKHRALRDLRRSICALNSFDSNTGMNLLRASIAPIAEGRPFFSSIVITGSHLKSLEAVAAGYAGIAAIDCVSFAHFRRFAPELTKRVWIIGESVGTPAPPFITSRHTNAKTLAILKDALNDVATAPQLECTRSALDLNGFAFESEHAYERLLRLEEDAASHGFPELR